MNERKRRPGRPPAGDRSVRANSTVKNAASEPVAHATSQWGGKRAGAGRPTKAKQRERAQEAAEAMVRRLGEPPNLKESMRRLHNAYESLLVAELAKGPHGSKKFIIECGQGMRGTADLITRIEQTESATPAAPAVIRAPPVEPDTETWHAKYAPPNAQEKQPPRTETGEPMSLPPADSADPNSGPPREDDFEPPARKEMLKPGPSLTGLGPHELGPLGPEQLADLQHLRRKGPF